MNNSPFGTEHASIVEALRAVIDPELHENVVDLGMVRGVAVSDGVARIEVALTIAGCPLRDQIKRDVEYHVGTLEGIDQVEVTIAAMEKDERAALMARARRLAQTRQIVDTVPTNTRLLAVVSGKGGVGKSSISANLAISLAARGLCVGLLDGDIWGFSIPRLVGFEGPMSVRNKKMIPKTRRVGQGELKVVSMGFLSGEDEAIMWRGLVLNRALQHFLEDVEWGDLDYLVVDMPPGTGDVQMGLARMLPRTELLVVTTPALAAEKVAGRAADMAKKGHLRIAGVIENMAGFTCEHGETYDLFGKGGGERLAKEVGAPLIASIPLDPSMTISNDAGEPAALDENSAAFGVFRELAAKIATTIAPVVAMASCSARLVEALNEAVAGANS